ncbi:unnamed protein product [Camellia sinensis]
MVGRITLGKVYQRLFENVNAIIGPALIGKDPTDQVAIDNFMVQQLDGTVNEWGWCKQKLGANAMLAVPLAGCKAGASVLNIPLYKHIANLAGNKKLVLPVPAFNVINGGSHAGNKLALQEVCNHAQRSEVPRGRGRVELVEIRRAVKARLPPAGRRRTPRSLTYSSDTILVLCIKKEKEL